MSDRTAYIYLGIRGDFDPHAFAAGIPLTPYKCVARHSHGPDNQLPKNSLLDYAYVETHADLINVEDMAESVVDILEPHVEALASAMAAQTSTIEVVFKVVVHFPVAEHVSTPILVFSKRVIAFMAGIGAYMDIDTYRR